MENYYITNTGNKFEILDKEIIDLKFKNIVEVKITKLEKCETLDLSYNNLQSFETDLPNCELLDISCNKLISFKANLPKCKYLDISCNKLQSFDADLLKCERLYINQNKLNSFKANLPNCNHLDISLNKLQSFEADLPNCKMLNIYNNNLKTIQLDIPKCERLIADDNCTIIDSKLRKIKGIDYIPTIIENTKKIDEFEIIKGYILNTGKPIYTAKKGKYTAHGETIKKAIEDCNFKFLRDTINVKDYANEVKEKGTMTISDYRLLTGACELGCKEFLKNKGIDKEELPLNEAIELVQGAYGYEKINELFNFNK